MPAFASVHILLYLGTLGPVPVWSGGLLLRPLDLSLGGEEGGQFGLGKLDAGDGPEGIGLSECVVADVGKREV
jgi:hypothetical protein